MKLFLIKKPLPKLTLILDRLFWIIFVAITAWATVKLIQYSHYGLLFDFSPEAFFRYIRYPILSFFGIFWIGYNLGAAKQRQKIKELVDGHRSSN